MARRKDGAQGPGSGSRNPGRANPAPTSPAHFDTAGRRLVAGRDAATQRCCPLARRFLALARRDGEAVALIGAEGEPLVTRAALASRAGDLAEAWAPLLNARAPVVLSLPNSPELVRSFLALRMLGVPVAVVDAAAPAAELGRCIATVGSQAALATSQRLPANEVAWAEENVVLARAAGSTRVAPPRGTAVLKLTSGSSGAPKAVAVSARQLAADTVQIMRTMGVRSDDVTLAAIPLTHSYGLGSCLVPLLLTGMPLAFPTCALPAALANTLERARIAHFPAVPAMIRALATLADLPLLPHLRVCLAAGAPLSPADAEAFHAVTAIKVHVFYGSSECGGITYDRGAEPAHEEGAVGTAMERVVVEVVDAAGSPLPRGREGRVRVRSRAAGLGLLPPGEEPGSLTPGTFLTGDVGRLDDGGRLTLTGRLVETLNVAGKKVHPDEVRRVVEAVPGVINAAVLGLPDRHRGDLVAAVVAVAPGSQLTVHTLIRACRARLAPHKVPRRIVLVDELPLSERGKLRKDAVLELLRGNQRG